MGCRFLIEAQQFPKMPAGAGDPIPLPIEQVIHLKWDAPITRFSPLSSLSCDHEFDAFRIAPPLLVYADLMDTGDDRNIEAAEIIYDNYLAQPDRQVIKRPSPFYLRLTQLPRA